MVWPILGSRTAKEQNRTFRMVMRPVRKVSSNCLSNGLSLHCEVLSRYSSFGIAKLFLRIIKASLSCRCFRRSTALVRSSILSLKVTQTTVCQRSGQSSESDRFRALWNKLPHDTGLIFLVPAYPAVCASLTH